jgi:hypothetical protein
MKLEGYAVLWDAVSADLGGFRERFARGAFGDLRGEDLRFLVGHNDAGVPLGRTKAGTMRVFQDSRGVGFEVDLPNSEPGRALGEAVKRGDLSQMSFGFVTTGDRWEQYGAGLLRTVTSARLSEISAVAFPAYPQTRVSVAGNSTPLEANRAAADLDLKFRRLAIARLR